ncbi:phosphotransferase family protein [Nocardioides sp. R-C-SC26]|uniref:phosphotransferase family protein n=1 Tax=Nocardioides sp. R-C-SC26 TaxID=2870414 RepID=UPI001E297F4B|nr:ecdysteroid 22-kinase family protein [Nocardioides sp. R-C-SC26]
MSARGRLVTTPEELTESWASAVFGAEIREVRREQVGTGQIGTCFRLHLDAMDDSGSRVPASVLVKLPAADPGTRELVAGTYRGEIRFYAELAPTVAIRVPACHLAVSTDSGAEFTLVMADLAPAEQGDQIAGCDRARAEDAVVNLAGLHGPRWCDPALLDIDGLTLSGPDDAAMLAELYGPTNELFLDGIGHLLDDDTAATLRDVVPHIEAWTLARAERFGLVHGDYRLDNLLFPPDVGQGYPGGVVAVDWQTLSLGLPGRDLAYLLGTSLDVELRREHERALVAAYHQALLGFGVTDYSFDDCWDDYRFAMLQGPLVAIFGCAYGTRTARGDAMFAAMVTRACAAIRDLGSLALV